MHLNLSFLLDSKEFLSLCNQYYRDEKGYIEKTRDKQKYQGMNLVYKLIKTLHDDNELAELQFIRETLVRIGGPKQRKSIEYSTEDIKKKKFLKAK